MTDWLTVNKFKRDFMDEMAVIRWNTVQFREGWTDDTMRTTMELACWCWKNGLMFATEVKMVNGRRADMVIPELNAPVIEIMDSEDYRSVEKKTAAYRKLGLDMVAVYANDWRQAINFVKAYNSLGD